MLSATTRKTNLSRSNARMYGQENLTEDQKEQISANQKEMDDIQRMIDESINLTLNLRPDGLF